jgi:hypothetical protein
LLGKRANFAVDVSVDEVVDVEACEAVDVKG